MTMHSMGVRQAVLRQRLAEGTRHEHRRAGIPNYLEEAANARFRSVFEQRHTWLNAGAMRGHQPRLLTPALFRAFGAVWKRKNHEPPCTKGVSVLKLGAAA